MQPALSTEEARTHIVEGSREAASSWKLLWLQNHLSSVCAWRGARLWRGGQVEEASEAGDLSICIIIGEGSCATAPREISAAGNTDFIERSGFFRCPAHASVSSIRNSLACIVSKRSHLSFITRLRPRISSQLAHPRCALLVLSASNL